MATFKALTRKDWRKTDGTYNVKIRITHKRKIRYIPTPFYLTQAGLTKGLNIKDRVVIEKTDEEIKRLRNKVYEIGFRVDNLDVDQLIRLLYQSSQSVCFTEYMQNKLDKLKDSGRLGTARQYQTPLNNLIKFNNGEPVYFEQMTKAFIADFYSFLKTKMIAKTANNQMAVLALYYSMARKELNEEESDIIIVKYHPFESLEKDKPEEVRPRAFDTIEQMQKVIDIPYQTNPKYSNMNFAKDMFVLSFVCMGINMADIVELKKSNLSADGILTYRRKKTERLSGSKSEIKIKLSDIAKIIIKKYTNSCNDTLITPPSCNANKTSISLMVNLKMHKVFADAGINSHREKDKFGIKQPKYSFYTARHSMATFARNICKIDKGTVHEMLNHAPAKEFAITDVYIRRDYSHLWEANEKLLALFNWDFYLKQA